MTVEIDVAQLRRQGRIIEASTGYVRRKTDPDRLLRAAAPRYLRVGRALRLAAEYVAPADWWNDPATVDAVRANLRRVFDGDLQRPARLLLGLRIHSAFAQRLDNGELRFLDDLSVPDRVAAQAASASERIRNLSAFVDKKVARLS